jgi:type I restriction enzyme S subunit
MSFPRYPAYKDSGVHWLGQIPAHWGVSQSRRMFKVRSEPALPTDRMLTASQKYGVLYQTDFVEREGRRVVEVLLGKESLKHVEPDDFIISMRSFQGGIEWCKLVGSTSFHYVMLTPVKLVHPPFFAHLLKSMRYIEALRTTTDLIRDGQELRFSNFAQVDLPVVPQVEQQAIAEFLDRETAKIDALVAEQEQLITLLKEKRQAVISHAVTKGLDPSVPMKDSGVEWLGEVPAHWAVGKCGFYLRILSGFAFPSNGFTTDDSAHRLLRGANVGVSRLKWDDTVYWERSEGDGLDEYEMAEGDLVIGMDRPLISEGMRVAKVTTADLPSLLLQRVASLKVGPRMNTDYLHHLLASEMFVAHFSPETTGVSVPHISPDQINNFVIPIPPLYEQVAIVEHVRGRLSSFDGLITEAVSAVDLLQERRSALISAAVTGQIDVRGLA